MAKAKITVVHTTQGFQRVQSVATLTVEIPKLGFTKYHVRSDDVTPELLEEYRLRGEKEIVEVIERYSVTRNQKDDGDAKAGFEATETGDGESDAGGRRQEDTSTSVGRMEESKGSALVKE
jgi:hypothetical protein